MPFVYLLYTFLMLLTLWLSSGTLAPYAATLPSPIVDPECGYLLNWDHEQFLMVFHMLDGEPPERWNRSIMLRRILFPLLSYVPAKQFGFIAGGFLTSAALHIVSGILFLRHIGRMSTVRAQYIAALILGTFPGIAYFGTLPYVYVCIVPFSLMSLMLLSKLETTESPRRTALVAGLCMSALCLGYDLVLFVLPAGIALLLMRRQFAAAGIYLASLVVAPAVWGMLLTHYFKVSFFNSNTEVYRSVVYAYLDFFEADLPEWGRLLSTLPFDFGHDLLFSAFFFLPVAVLIVIIWQRCSVRHLFTRAEAVWLLVICGVWIFNNAAPPYQANSGWVLRGPWIARLYEPVFAALLLFYARTVVQNRAAFQLVVTCFLLIGQSVIVFGPWIGLERISAMAYSEFYRHSSPEIFPQNLVTYGKHPVGSCPAAEKSREQRRPRIFVL